MTKSAEQVTGQVSSPANSITKRMLLIHGWSGVVLGLLLYAVILTGAFAVYHDEIGNWSSPLAQTNATPFAPGLGQTIQHIAESIDPAYHDEILLLPSTGGRIRASFMSHPDSTDDSGENEGKAVRYDFNPKDWRVTQLRQGTAMAIHKEESAGALADFLVDIHVRLYVPTPWGLLLTGVLGLAMLTAAITGVIIHRKIITQIFLRRISLRNPLLSTRDRHVSAGVWNLLFALLLAFTGSFFSFAGTLGLPVLAAVASGGDIEGMLASISGAPIDPHAVDAPMVDLDTIIIAARKRTIDESREISSVVIERWGRSDAAVSIGLSERSGELIGDVLMYQGDSGQFIMHKPFLGLTPSLGNTLVSLMTPLHYGYFAGWLSKLIWFALGCAAAYVTVTGLLLWIKRRQHDAKWQQLHRLTVWVVTGLPLALAASVPGFFYAESLNMMPLAAVQSGFLLAVLVASLICLLTRNPVTADKMLTTLLAIVLLIMPLARIASGGISWSNALLSGWSEVVVIDCLLLIAAVCCAWRVWQLHQQKKNTLKTEIARA